VRIRIGRLPLSTRAHRWMTWCCRMLLAIGVVALAYVGMTVIESRLYQASAKQSLETQIHTIKGPHASQLRLPVNPGDVLGRLDIPRLGISVAILQGTSLRTLRLGAGHIDATPLPGESGNSGIAGHRDTFFRELRNVRKTDTIQLQTATGVLHYEVDWVKVVRPDDISVLAASSESALTLVTCYPFNFVGSASDRFIVHARLSRPSL
jgi:sortase A